MDHLMLNTFSKTYLHLPKRGEWSNNIWEILEFVQTFDDIKIIDEDNPNFGIILGSPDWDSYENRWGDE